MYRGRYGHGRDIGSGSYGICSPLFNDKANKIQGEVFHTHNVLTNEEFAIKLSPANDTASMLRNEYNVLCRLRGVTGIPCAVWFESDSSYNAIILECLGPSLPDLMSGILDLKNGIMAIEGHPISKLFHHLIQLLIFGGGILKLFCELCHPIEGLRTNSKKLISLMDNILRDEWPRKKSGKPSPSLVAHQHSVQLGALHRSKPIARGSEKSNPSGTSFPIHRTELL